MKSIRASESRAGLLPFFWNEKEKKYEYLFFISSDSTYGGNRPQISKGHLDPGESAVQAALREAKEELGFTMNLAKKHPFLFWSKPFKGQVKSYVLKLWAIELKDKEGLLKPEYETEKVVWMSEAEFKLRGRPDQITMVSSLEILLQRLIDRN